jgi:hypothetical protein
VAQALGVVHVLMPRLIQDKVLMPISESACGLRNSMHHPGNAGLVVSSTAAIIVLLEACRLRPDISISYCCFGIAKSGTVVSRRHAIRRRRNGVPR